MEALGQLSLVDRARAEIQKYVGEFLASRKILTDLLKHPSLQIVSKANGLLSVQTKLEGDLQTNLAVLDEIQKSGVYDLSKMLSMGAFAAQLYKQINDVKNLKAEADGVAPGWESKISSDIWKGWAVPIGLGVLGLVLILFGRK